MVKKSKNNNSSIKGQNYTASFIKKIEKEPALAFLPKLKKEYPKSEIFLVGGMVRDILLKKPSKDYDFVVRGVPAKKLEKFLSARGKVDLVGRNFGVFKFNPKKKKLNQAIDIALPRTEHAKGTGGYRDFEIQTDPNLILEADLARRDFTINAMAWDINKKALIDPFEGQYDLREGYIRAVGKPQERFKEDYSRMLRAIRFACQLGFKIEDKTWQGIKKSMPNLDKEIKKQGKKERIVPLETAAKELLKAFTANPVKALELFDKSGALKILMPELLKMKKCPQPENFHSEGDVWKHTKLALEKLFSTEFKEQFGDEKPSAELVMAVLFHDIGKPYTIQTPQKHGTDRIRFNEHDQVGAKLTEKICKRLKLSSTPGINFKPERVAWLVKSHLLTIHGDISKMRNKTIEKYFFNPKYSGKDLLKLSFVDALSTIPKNGKPDLENFYKTLERIEELKKILGARAKEEKLPPLPIDGNDIMKKFGLKQGPKIGKLLEAAREAQLEGKIKTKKEALNFLKKKIKKGR